MDRELLPFIEEDVLKVDPDPLREKRAKLLLLLLLPRLEEVEEEREELCRGGRGWEK